MQELSNQDGFVENLFLYLWMQDPIMKQVPNINIPDTIIYRNSRIFQWYFSSDGQIKKKSRQKLNNDHIYEKFLKKTPKCGIVAVWIHRQQESLGKNKSEKMTYQYLDSEELQSFIANANPNEIREGVLQKFTVPKGESNSVLQVVWSQNLCFFEKIQNQRRLNDKNLDIYQRVLTYEVGNTNSEVIQLKGSYLISSLETIAHNIKQHIANLSFDRFKVTRLNLIFKLNEQNNLILLGCTSLRVDDKKLTNKNCEKLPQINVELPSNIDLARMSMQLPVSLKLDNQCSNCQRLIDEFGTYEINIKFVIQSWDFDHDGKKQNFFNKEKQSQIAKIKNSEEHHKANLQNFKQSNDFAGRIQSSEIFLDVEKSYNIPRALRNIMPKLKEDKYIQLKQNPGFLDKNIEVCEQCYLDMMASCNIYESFEKITKQIDMQNDFQGIGKLKPEVLNERFNRTRKNIQLKQLFEEEDEGEGKKKNEHDGMEFKGFFKFSENMNQDIKKFNNVLNKVGLKTNMRSKNYIDQLQHNKLHHTQQQQDIGGGDDEDDDEIQQLEQQNTEQDQEINLQSNHILKNTQPSNIVMQTSYQRDPSQYRLNTETQQLIQQQQQQQQESSINQENSSTNLNLQQGEQSTILLGENQQQQQQLSQQNQNGNQNNQNNNSSVINGSHTLQLISQQSQQNINTSEQTCSATAILDENDPLLYAKVYMPKDKAIKKKLINQIPPLKQKTKINKKNIDASQKHQNKSLFDHFQQNNIHHRHQKSNQNNNNNDGSMINDQQSSIILLKQQQLQQTQLNQQEQSQIEQYQDQEKQLQIQLQQVQYEQLQLQKQQQQQQQQKDGYKKKMKKGSRNQSLPSISTNTHYQELSTFYNASPKSKYIMGITGDFNHNSGNNNNMHQNQQQKYSNIPSTSQNRKHPLPDLKTFSQSQYNFKKIQKKYM